MSTNAKHFHFVFGLREQNEPFHLAWYLCLRSCIEVNQPDCVSFYYLNEPYGRWWDKIKSKLNLVKISQLDTGLDQSKYDQHSEGQFIKMQGLAYAHHADVIRLQVLLQEGGVYADIDSLFVKPYPSSFYQHDCLLGRESADSDELTLCNAVIFSQPESAFIQKWLDEMFEAFDGSWNKHSCALAGALSLKYPELVKVVSPEHFFHFGYTQKGIAELFGMVSPLPDELYSIHMWSHLWWEPHRTDFARFHNGMLTEDFIKKVDTSYNLIARQYLD